MHLPLVSRGGGRYLTPDWLQKTGIEPRTCTNDTTCGENSMTFNITEK